MKEKRELLLASLANSVRLLDQERTARAEAEAAVRMRDEFAAIASHELRSPVTVIKTTTQVLLRDFDQGPVKPAYVISRLRTVALMADQLNMLIGDLLEVSLLRVGRLHLRPERIDLAGLAREVVTEYRAQLGSEYPLKLRVVGTLPQVSVDPRRMQEVFSNLVENAVKYSPDGGLIDVSLRRRDQGVLVRVSDHGMGIPHEAAESVFEPFGRAINAQQQQLPGMGLGLYIARQIVDQHGGRIWARSAGEGLGTQFNVWLPGIQQPAIEQRSARVLIVDDDAAIRDALSDLFELEGYVCRAAGNGQEALGVLSDWQADLIVLDLKMPVMDGWTFRREQQAVPTVRDIPVIVISARPTEDSRDAALAAAAIVSKPFELSVLVSAVQGVLSGGGQSPAAA